MILYFSLTKVQVHLAYLNYLAISPLPTGKQTSFCFKLLLCDIFIIFMLYDIITMKYIGKQETGGRFIT